MSQTPGEQTESQCPLQQRHVFPLCGEIEDMLGFLLDFHCVNATGAIVSIVKKGRSYTSFHIQTHRTGFHNNSPHGLVNPVKWGDSQSSLINNLACQNQNI